MTAVVPVASIQPTMTIEDARRFLGISRATAYEAAKSGELPTISMGRRLLVPTAALRRMLKLDDAPGQAAVVVTLPEELTGGRRLEVLFRAPDEVDVRAEGQPVWVPIILCGGTVEVRDG